MLPECSTSLYTTAQNRAGSATVGSCHTLVAAVHLMYGWQRVSIKQDQRLLNETR